MIPEVWTQFLNSYWPKQEAVLVHECNHLGGLAFRCLHLRPTGGLGGGHNAPRGLTLGSSVLRSSSLQFAKSFTRSLSQTRSSPPASTYSTEPSVTASLFHSLFHALVRTETLPGCQTPSLETKIFTLKPKLWSYYPWTHFRGLCTWKAVTDNTTYISDTVWNPCFSVRLT